MRDSVHSHTRSPRNKTIALTTNERAEYSERLAVLTRPVDAGAVRNRTINQDAVDALPLLPEEFVDLLFLDPPYNLNKSFNGSRFGAQSLDAYESWMESWFPNVMRALKSTASVYVCSDWRSAAPVQRVLDRYLNIQNRITWEREKGRGARSNWKNCSEDIWFCTVSKEYTFNVDDVKLRRRVVAPYRKTDGEPKDWERTAEGDFRLTHPSNLWTDLTVPFWSMPENTDHPTQKPEKLLAKLLLASSECGSMVLDPFAGSGTAAVVSKKLGRDFVSIEVDREYCCIAEKRLAIANSDSAIQGYEDGVFLERNAGNLKQLPRFNEPVASQFELRVDRSTG